MHEKSFEDVRSARNIGLVLVLYLTSYAESVSWSPTQ